MNHRLTWFLFLILVLAPQAKTLMAKGPEDLSSPSDEKASAEKTQEKEQPKPEGEKPTDIEKKEEKEGEKEKKNEKKEPSAAEKFFSRVSLSSGFGWIRAYTGEKNNLRSNGFSDLKIGFLLPVKIFTKNLTATVRYSAFSVAPISDKDTYQEYLGVIETVGGGIESTIVSTKILDLLVSLEAALSVGHYKTLIEVSGGTPPSKYGSLFLAGIETRFKPLNKFHIGPRIHYGVGTISTFQALLNFTLHF